MTDDLNFIKVFQLQEGQKVTKLLHLCLALDVYVLLALPLVFFFGGGKGIINKYCSMSMVSNMQDTSDNMNPYVLYIESYQCNPEHNAFDYLL